VLVRGVLSKEFAVCGALEGLEAGLALDGLGGGVLCAISSCAYEELLRGRRARHGVVRISAATWPPWGRRRPCGRASAVLYVLLVWPCFSLLSDGVLGSVTHVVSRRGLVGDCVSKSKCRFARFVKFSWSVKRYCRERLFAAARGPGWPFDRVGLSLPRYLSLVRQPQTDDGSKRMIGHFYLTIDGVHSSRAILLLQHATRVMVPCSGSCLMGYWSGAHVVGLCGRRDKVTSQPANDMASMTFRLRYYMMCDHTPICL
jgi:hypothetical protein